MVVGEASGSSGRGDYERRVHLGEGEYDSGPLLSRLSFSFFRWRGRTPHERRDRSVFRIDVIPAHRGIIGFDAEGPLEGQEAINVRG